MTMKYGLFPSEATTVDGVTTYDRAVDDDFMAKYMKGFFTDGVFPYPGSCFKVNPLAKAGMGVTVSAGSGLIEGHFGYDDDSANLTIEAADTSLPRIDRVVFRLTHIDRQILLAVKKGKPATSPSAPALTNTSDVKELALADVYVGKKVSAIAASNITDTRINKSLCGLVSPLTAVINSSDYNSQLQSAFTIFFDDVKNTLGEDSAGNLLNLYNNLSSEVTANKVTTDATAASITSDNTLRSTLFGVKLDGDKVYTKECTIIPFAVSATSVGGVKDTDYAHLKSNGQVEILKKGIYQVDFLAHCSAMVANNVLHVGIWKNKTTTPVLVAENLVRRAGRTDVCSGTASGLVQCNAGDLLSGYICNEKDDYHYRLSGEHCKFRVYLLKDLS